MSLAPDTYVIFELAGTSYGVPSSDVRHLEMLEHVTPVPNAMPAIDGVVFSRGQVIPAMNLRTRFGLPREPYSLRTRLLFVQVRQRTVGLIVDTAREFIRLPPETIRPIEQTLAGVSANYLKAVAQIGDRLILLLDLEAVVNVDASQAPTALPASVSQADRLPADLPGQFVQQLSR